MRQTIFRGLRVLQHRRAQSGRPLLSYERLFVCQSRPEVLGGKDHDGLRRLVTSTGADAMSSWW